MPSLCCALQLLWLLSTITSHQVVVTSASSGSSSHLPLSQLSEELEVEVDEGVQLREQPVQQLGLHVQVGRHPLAEHLLDHLQQLAVVLLRDDELVDVLLPLGLVLLQRRGHAVWHGGRPGLGLLPLDPERGVRVQVAEADGEGLGEVLGGEQLRVQEVLPIPVNILANIRGLAADKVN